MRVFPVPYMNIEVENSPKTVSFPFGAIMI